MFVAFLLSLLMAFTPAYAESPWKQLTWTTRDGIKLVGLYRPASREGAFTWVLLHGLGSHKDEWQDFGNALAEQGNGIFIYDMRGHDASTHTATGDLIDYKTWQSAGPGTPWDAMPADLVSAVQLLHKKYGLSERKIAVGGASLGANVALVYASRHPLVPALILLSPGIQYAGIESGPAYKAYQGRPVFIAASPSDEYAYSSVRRLSDLAPSPAQKVVEGKGGHGVQMFRDEEFTKTLLAWMKG